MVGPGLYKKKTTSITYRELRVGGGRGKAGIVIIQRIIYYYYYRIDCIEYFVSIVNCQVDGDDDDDEFCGVAQKERKRFQFGVR